MTIVIFLFQGGQGDGGGGPSKKEVRKSFHNQFCQQVYMLLSVLLLEFDLRERIRLFLV